MPSVRDRLLGPPKSKPETAEKLLHLHLTHHLDSLTITNHTLESSSATISSIFAANQSLLNRVAIAADALGHFRRKVERDQRFVIAAFWLMCTVAVVVVARRIGVLWVVKTAATGLTRMLFSKEDPSQEL